MFHCVPIACRNFSSAPGPLRELEAEQPLVRDAATVAADHVAHVQLRHLVVAHVDDRVAGVAQRSEQRLLFLAAFRQAQADEELRGAASSW